MGVINILSGEVSNKIAAGEVVERPASVVKELVENSIDAGADSIVVEIKNGGNSYIRVSDNGIGMSADDAKTAFLRHATSKISSEEDLDAIATLGFRGEALSSIGAVAKVDLTTCRDGDDFGSHVRCVGGAIEQLDDTGMARGTTFIVEDLFFNTPARRKFLKKDATEAGHINDIMTRFVLAHPEISFKLISNGREQIFSSGDSRPENAVFTVYGRDYARAAVKVDYTLEGIHVCGLCGKGSICRPNRGYESFFVNGRYVRSPLIMKAVEEAYKNQIMIGKYPMAVLHIIIDPSEVDINVHPTKLEVKFANENLMYQAVYHAVKNALYALPDIPEIERTENKADKRNESLEELFDLSRAAAEANKSNPFFNGAREERGGNQAARKPVYKMPDFSYKADERKPESEPVIKEYHAPERKAPILKPEGTPSPTMAASVSAGGSATISKDITSNAEQEVVIGLDDITERMPRIVGQVFETYIVAQLDEDILIFDQHAAHERLRYEELKKDIENHTPDMQMLLEPVIAELTPVEMAVYNENTELLESLGFDTAVFGDNCVSINAAPGGVEWSDTEDLFIELLGQIADNKNEIISEKIQRAVYTIACKGAIKANLALDTFAMNDIVRAVLSLDNINTCPHGRPIMIKLSKRELEKEFKRIV